MENKSQSKADLVQSAYLLEPSEREHTVSRILEWIDHPDSYPKEISAEALNSLLREPLLSWLKHDPKRQTAPARAFLTYLDYDIISRFANRQFVVREQVEKLDHLWREFQIDAGWASVAIADKEKRSQSKRNKSNASKPRKEIAKEDLLPHREAWYAEHGHYQGWQKAASRHFDVSVDVIRNRMKL